MEKTLKQNSGVNSNCIKVVLFGPESTWKSSLAKALSVHYNTVYVGEFSRAYAEAKAQQNLQLTKEDVLPIAIGQMQWENEQINHANKLLICDTDLLETLVYSKFYYNEFCPEGVEKYALENTYNLYFLTYIDTVWVGDGIRDQPNSRLQLFNRFKQALVDANKPYVLLEGSFEERLNTCKNQIDNLLTLEH